MVRSEIVHIVDKLEQAIMELVYVQRKTQIWTQNLTELFTALQKKTMKQTVKEMKVSKN